MDEHSVDDLGVSDGNATKKRKSNCGKPKHRNQKYRPDWKKEEVFKDWIECDLNDEYKAKCKLWKVSIVAKATVLKNHTKSKKHAALMSGKSTSQKGILQFTMKSSSEDVKQQESVHRAEIMLAGYFAEHNLPFLASDHLIEVLKNIFPDSTIAKNINMKRTKTTAVIKNVIGATQKRELSEILRRVKFSILTDE